MKLAQLIKTFSMLCLLFPLLQSGCGSATTQRGSESADEYQRIEEKIRGIVAKQLDLKVQEVDVDVQLSKLKKPADELDVIEIIMNVEEAFSIEIKDDEVSSGNVSVKALADIVSRKKS
jgi:acyl carrier protein